MVELANMVKLHKIHNKLNCFKWSRLTENFKAAKNAETS